MTLEMSFWPERNPKGISQWRLHLPDRKQFLLPSRATLNRLFRKVCPRATKDIELVNNGGSNNYILMPSGVRPAARESFREAIEAKIKVL